MKSSTTPVAGPGRSAQIISGWRFRWITFRIGLRVTWLAMRKYPLPWRLFRVARQVIGSRKQFKTMHPRIVRAGSKYYMNLHTPGWPSKAFDRSIQHALNLLQPVPSASLFSVIFAITNKCGFHCEHCVEWDQLNRNDALSTDDLVEIVRRFEKMGVSQIHLSGGEPLNRFPDLLSVLDAVPDGIDFWIFTNGYSLSAEKARKLRQHGLTGVIISLDHASPALHDRFRGVTGSFERAIASARHARQEGLLVAFSCCATEPFVSNENLLAYLQMARQAGASFVQFLEPEPVGHYDQKPIRLSAEKTRILEAFFYRVNFGPAYADYPIISYPALVKREEGCPGAGLHYLYVDADGSIQACPFCKSKLFDAFSPDLEKQILSLRKKGCPLPGALRLIETAGMQQTLSPNESIPVSHP